MEKLGDYAGALADYERAYEERSEDPNILNRLAWSLATCPDGRYRDGQRAVRLAQQAVELARCGPTLDTLAAACAEVGDFEQAVRQQEEAIAAVVEEGREELLEEFKERLLGYKAGEPWRAGQ
jgi:tetratricopeptide (TPR) repeat protein